MDVNGAMLTAGWNQMLLESKYNMDILHRM
jgi:hypothetical protein